MPAFRTISAAEAGQIIEQGNPTILDCRKLSDYRKGRIGNAMLVHEQLRDTLLRNAGKHQPVLIYCYHGHSSEHLAEMFCDFGFKEVYSLAGGYASWQEYHKAEAK